MKFTVFTPTYNRKKKLENLYQYLKNENYEDMEWLIIDDGSKDGTKEYIDSIIDKVSFQIRYIYQENAGKHNAFNRAIEEAKGLYFVCIDSDDCYVEGSFKKLGDIADTLSEDEAGICYLASDFAGNLIGTEFPKNLKNANLIDLQYKYGVTGDKGILHKTSVLKKFRFPLVVGEKFMTETVIYAQISMEYTYRLVNSIYELVEYQPEGLSAKYKSLIIKNPKSSLINYRLIDKFDLKGIMKIRNMIRYLSFIYYLEGNWKAELKQCRHKILFVLLSPVGLMVCNKYKKEYKK